MASTLFVIIEILAIIIYSILVVLCVFSFWRSHNRKDFAVISKVFHFFIFLFVAGRLGWYILRWATGSGPITFFLNNQSFICYVSGLLIILFYWIETYYSTYVSTTQFLPKMKVVFISVNSVVYLVELILIILYYTVNHSKKEGSVVYLLNSLYQVFLSMALGVGFSITYIRIYFKYTSIDRDVCRNQIVQVRKLFILTLCFGACFIMRSIIFLYNPITGKWMNDEVFITMGYFIPDIIPTLLQIYIIHTRMKNQEEDTSYINSLYENEMEEDTLGNSDTNSPTPTPNPSYNGVLLYGDGDSSTSSDDEPSSKINSNSPILHNSSTQLPVNYNPPTETSPLFKSSSSKS